MQKAGFLIMSLISYATIQKHLFLITIEITIKMNMNFELLSLDMLPSALLKKQDENLNTFRNV